MADVLMSWKLGIDQVSTKTNLPTGTVVDAVNVDIDRASTLSRRSGYTSILSQSGVHDLWTSNARGDSFAAVGGYLCHVNYPWHSTQLQALAHDAPLSYEDLNGDVICSSRYEILVISPDYAVRRLGVELPGAPSVVATSNGGFDPGGYGVAVSFMRGDEEGPLSPASFVTLGAGQGLSITPIPPSSIDDSPTGWRIYRTQTNGDVLYRVADLLIGTTSYIMGISAPGRQAQFQFLERMIPGDFVRYWRGRLWTVRGNTIFFSEPLNYGMYDPRSNIMQMQSAIRLFEPVEGGIYVGTKDGVVFLAGKRGGMGRDIEIRPEDLTVTQLGGLPPIKGSGIRIPSSLLPPPDGESGEYVALWLSANGFVVGSFNAKLLEYQRTRIKIDDTSGTSAVVVHDRQVTAVVS